MSDLPKPGDRRAFLLEYWLGPTSTFMCDWKWKVHQITSRDSKGHQHYLLTWWATQLAPGELITAKFCYCKPLGAVYKPSSTDFLWILEEDDNAIEENN